jgi:hypothetical protein
MAMASMLLNQPPHLTSSLPKMKLLGGLVFVAGVFLWCGNVFGFFPTFPMVGYLTAAFGGWIMRSGGGGEA